MSLHDQQARDRIRDDLDTTLVVEAAAGTGKTTALIGRILAIIESGRGQLQDMIALTFTDKAAGEMKLRLRTELERARERDGGGHGDTTVRERRLGQALAALEQAHIGTIHAFCGDLLHERPVEAGVDPRFEVAGEDETEALFGLVFDRFIQDCLQAPPDGVRRALRRGGPGRSALEQVAAAARTLREQRDFEAPWRRPELAREPEVDQALMRLSELGKLAEVGSDRRDPLRRDLQALADFVQQRQRLERVGGVRDYDELEASLGDLLRQGIWKRRGRGKFYTHGLLRDEVIAVREAVREQLARLVERLDADLAALLREDLRPVIEEYERAKAQAGKLDYLDLLCKVRDLLAENASVRRGLQERFTHVFVDEFQDTDPIQAEIIELLCRDEQATGEAAERILVPGKLFVVGDPKQAIYRFRRADVTLYERIKRQLVTQGGEVVYLTTSFRSVPGVQSLVNAAFSEHIQAAPDGSQAAYHPLSPFRQPIEGQPSVVALPVPRPFGQWGYVTRAAIDESLPDAVAAFIDHVVRDSGFLVSEGGQLVPASARHVCLLFRRFRSFGQDVTRGYTRALESRAIPHVLLGGRSFHDREEVLAMGAALSAIEWPHDQLFVYAALRGPLFSFCDEALLDYRHHVGPLHPLVRQTGLRGMRAEVAEALALLGDLHVRRNRRAAAETIAELLDATRAHAGFAIWPAGEQALANVMRIADQARRRERGGATSFRAFVEWLRGGGEAREVRDAPVIEDGTDGVRVMTVHTAKGLEFPIVILCDPTVPRKARRPSRYIDGSRGLWACGLCGCAPLDLIEHEQQVLRADDAEEVRIAYVAATRARDMLVVPVVGDAPREGWVDVLHRGLYPAPADRRNSQPAPGCPAFGDDSVVAAPVRAQRTPEDSVRPGLHAPAIGDHRVVWWGPAQLRLSVESIGGIRQQEILMEDDAGERARAGVAMHQRWQARRKAALDSGVLVRLMPITVTELSHATPEAAHVTEATTVEVVCVASRDPERPRGTRFGSLTHAVIADAGFVWDAGWLTSLAHSHGRTLGATQLEIAAAATAAASALQHSLLKRAAASSDARFESPVSLLDGNRVLEGVVDLAFLEDTPEGQRWTVVDFKTDADPGVQPAYVRQLELYATAISRATGLPVHSVLLAV